jgi:hypothetical protein
MTTALQIAGDVMQRPKRETSFQVRVTWEEAETFKEAADIEGMHLSAWVRQKCRDGARETLAKVGKTPNFNGRAK